MSQRLLSRGSVLVGAESFPGLAATLTAANYIETFGPPRVVPVQEMSERSDVAKGTLGHDEAASAVRYAQVSFYVELKGTNRAALGNSSSGLTEQLTALLSCVGLAPTYVAPVGGSNTGYIKFTKTNSPGTCTMEVYEDGTKYSLRGVVGDAKFSFDNTDVQKIEFVLLGIWTNPTDVALPSVAAYLPLSRSIPGFPVRSGRMLTTPVFAGLLDTSNDENNTNPNWSNLSSTKLPATQTYACCVYDRTKDNFAAGDNWYREGSKSWNSSWGDLPMRTFWVATAAEVKVYNGEDGALIATLSFGASKWLATGLTYNRIFALNGVIYVATSSKLYTIELKNDRFGRYDTSGYTYSDITIAQYASNCTYGNNTAALAIVDNDCRHVHGNIVAGETVIGVSTANGWTGLNLSDTTAYDYVVNTTANAVACSFVTAGGSVYWASQVHATETDYKYLFKSPLPSADDTAVANGATHRVFTTASGTSGTNILYMDFGGTSGSSGNTSITSVSVLEDKSELVSTLDRIVVGTPSKGAVLIDEATALDDCTWQRITQDYMTAPMYEETVFAGMYEEETISSVIKNDRTPGSFEPTATSLTHTNDTTVGRAADFDGSASNGVYANSGSSGENFRATGAFSIAFWIKPDTIAGTDVLINKQDNAGAQQAYLVRLDAGVVQFFVYDKNAGPDVYIGKATASAITAGAWHHVVATYDGATTTALYVDGTVQTTPLTNGSFVALRDVTTSLYVGVSDTGSSYYDGRMHGFHFLNGKALSAAEAARDYRAGLYRADGSCFLSGASDVINDVYIDMLGRLHIAANDDMTIIDSSTNAQVASYNKTAVQYGCDEFGDFRCFAQNPGFDLVHAGATVRDCSGNGLHMHNIAGVKSDYFGANLGLPMFTFDGSSQYLRGNYSSARDIATVATFFGVFLHGTIATSADTLIDLRDATGTGAYVEMTSSGTVKAAISDDSGATEDAITSSSEYDDSAIHTFCYIISATTHELFIDGQSVGSGSRTNAASSIAGKYPRLFVGRKANAASQYWEGKLFAVMMSLAAERSAVVSDLHAMYAGYIQRRTAIVALNNELTPIKNAALANDNYIHGFQIANWAPTFEMRMLFPLVTEYNVMEQIMTNNPGIHRLSLQANPDDLDWNNCKAELLINYQPLGSPVPAEQEGVRALDIKGVLVETPGNENDQLALIIRG